METVRNLEILKAKKGRLNIYINKYFRYVIYNKCVYINMSVYMYTHTVRNIDMMDRQTIQKHSL